MTNQKHGPPTNIDPSDLWAQITTLPRAHRVVPFPRDNQDGVPVGNVSICVLTGDEVQIANFSAEKYMRDQAKKQFGEVPKKDEQSDLFRDLYSSRATREILFRATKKADQCVPDTRGVCIEPHETMQAFFPTMEAIGKLSTDEQAVLMRHYMQTQAEVGPIVSNMSQAEMDAWIEVLAEGGSRAPLGMLSLDQVNELLMYMAEQLYALRTDSSSPGTPPEGGTKNE